MIPANPYTGSHPLLPMPPMPNDIISTITKHVDSRLDEVMSGKDENLNKSFEKFIHHMVKKFVKEYTNHEGKEEEHTSPPKKSPLEKLYCKLHCYQKSIHEGKPIMEIEKELYEKHDNLSNDEKRVFASLLRADGPYTLAGMIGMNYDDYISHMEHLGERFLEE